MTERSPKPSKPEGVPSNPRRKQKQLNKAAIGKLAKQFPEHDKLLSAIFDLGVTQSTTSSDREAVIIAAALLENQLKLVIKKYFHPNITDAEADEIFGDPPKGLLRDFYARIEIAHKLGILSDKEKKSFHSIRVVRNAFAHAPIKISFQDAEIISACADIPPPIGDVHPEGLNDREKFIATVSYYCWSLSMHAKHEPYASQGILGSLSLPRLDI
jgi:hypothetical protein